MKNVIIRVRFEEYNVADASRNTRTMRESILQSVPDALINVEHDPQASEDAPDTIMVIVTTELKLDRVKEALQWWQHSNIDARITVEGNE